MADRMNPPPRKPTLGNVVRNRVVTPQHLKKGGKPAPATLPPEKGPDWTHRSPKKPIGPGPGGGDE